MGNKVSSGSDTRLIEVGFVSLEDEKKHNKIKTTRYTLINFLPKNMIEQFRRIANFYFLLLTVLAFMINSPVSPYSTLLPLAFVVTVTAIKQGYEDFLRHRSDNAVNNEKVEIISKNTVQKVRSREVRPGTLVRVRRGHDVPADLVLIYSSDPDGKCHITTANLDGETNLKTLRVPAPLVGHTPEVLPKGVKIEAPPPMTDLYTFYGSIDLPESSLALGIENLMLRGSRVKNTEWAIGCAVYTGEETKLALNSRFSSNKFTACERKINVFLLLFIGVLIASILISFMIKLLIERGTGMHDFYLGESEPLTTLSALQDIFSFLLLYYYLIPISLYVTIELYKFIGSLFIKWDDELTCYSTNQPAVANTSDLNEELGQVEILFSDKTGTLTKNIMNFKMCSINGKIYEERLGQLFDNSSWNEAEDTFKPDLKFFFTILALCHTVQVGDDFRRSSTLKKSASSNFLSKIKWRKPQTSESFMNEELLDTQIYPKYQASSPDEKALVEAAARANATFIGESGKYLQVDFGNDNIENFELLQVLEFTSERKRMSVIIRDKDQKIWLYCKGAESSVLPLCRDSSLIEETNKHVDHFARQGLRTLAIAYREISNEEYDTLLDDLNKLRSTASTEATLKELVTYYRKLEQGLSLAGATAVEDLLQDNVSETLSSLRKAGMRIWVLTGDKVETAINVAQSCSHMPEHTEMMFLVDIKTDEAMQLQLNACIRNIANRVDHNVTLVVDGQSLARILGKIDEESLFLEVSLFCTAVLCCRLSPLQKAEIVRLIKNSAKKPITAAIGDGANDISMIQEAHVGIGIFGKEGRQAARSADYAFSNFCMLRKLLIVSGHWYYQRLATLVLYFFYKNMTFVLLMLYFQINSHFSTHSIFDSMYLACYNLFFTSIPCFVLSVTEQCKPQRELLREPELYQSNQKNKLMSWFHLTCWTLAAIYHSMMIYLVAWYLFGPPVINLDGTVVDIWCFGIVLYHYLILVVNFKLWLQARYQTIILIAAVFVSFLLLFVLNIGYTFIILEPTMHVLGTYERLLTAPAFWFGSIIVVCLALLPDFCLRIFRNIYKTWKKGPSDPYDDEITQSTAL